MSEGGPYASLRNVLDRAFDQAASGKGADRHANGLPFDQQPMQTINYLAGAVVWLERHHGNPTA